MLFQSVATNSRPNSLQSKLIRISHASAQGAEIHHSRVGETERERARGGLGERIRELEVLLASEKESERASEQEKRRVKTGRKKEIESHHGAQESPALRKATQIGQMISQIVQTWPKSGLRAGQSEVFTSRHVIRTDSILIEQKQRKKYKLASLLSGLVIGGAREFEPYVSFIGLRLT